MDMGNEIEAFCRFRSVHSNNIEYFVVVAAALVHRRKYYAKENFNPSILYTHFFS